MLNSFVKLLVLIFSINLPVSQVNKVDDFHLHTNIPQKYSLFFSVDSPFKNEYGTYNLTDTGHSINDYIENLTMDLSYASKSLVIKAPYLLYTSSENRYYEERTVDTIEGTTITATYDTWSLTYNDQPYVTNGDITVKGYMGETFIKNLTFTLSGNALSTIDKYYLQDLTLSNLNIDSSINTIKLLFNSIHYTASYNEEITSEDLDQKVYSGLTGTYTRTISGTQAPSVLWQTVNWTFVIGDNEDYQPGSATLTDSGSTLQGYRSAGEPEQNGNKVTVHWEINTKTKVGRRAYNFVVKIKTDKYTYEYWKTITTYTFTGTTISNPTLNVYTQPLSWFPSYFLETISCSGRGDQNDKNMITSRWGEVKEYFLNLSTEYQDAFSSGELTDPMTNEALIRYDYIVFYKGYGVDDFLNRSGNSNIYGSKNNINAQYLMNNLTNDSTVTLVIICSSICVISLTTILVIMIKKRR